MSQHVRDLRFGVNPETKAWEHLIRRSVADGTKPYSSHRMLEAGREGRPFLERYLPTSSFCYCSWPATDDGLQHMQHLRVEGVNENTVPGWGPERFSIVDSDIRDEIRSLAVPEAEAGRVSKQAMGFIIAPGTSPLKVAKAMPFQPFRWDGEKQAVCFGEPIKVTEQSGIQTVWNRLESGQVIAERFYPADPGRVDGNGLITPETCKLLWSLEDVRDGDGLGVKFHGLAGHAKGNYIAKSGMDVNVVHYGPRPGIKFQHFFAGLRTELHAGDPRHVRLDQQSIVHFLRKQEGCDTLLNLVKSYFDQLRKEVSTPEGRRERGLRGRALPKDYSALHDWAAADIDTSQGLVGLLRQQVAFQLETGRMAVGKVPVMGEAQHAYLALLPECFNGLGAYAPEGSTLRGNTVYIPGMAPGAVSLYRHPNVEREIWLSENVNLPKNHPARGMGRGQVIWVSPDILKALLARLGYGDLDDMAMVVHGKSLLHALLPVLAA